MGNVCTTCNTRSLSVRSEFFLLTGRLYYGLGRQFEKLGYDAVGGTPEAFASYIRTEYEKYGKIVKLIGAKVD